MKNSITKNTALAVLILSVSIGTAFAQTNPPINYGPSGGAGTGNANISPATGNTAGDAVVMANTATGLADAGFVPAPAGQTQIITSNPTITATNVADCKIFAINAGSLTNQLPAAASVSANGCLAFITPNVTSITRSGSDTINGLTSAATVQAGITEFAISDGVSAWIVGTGQTTGLPLAGITGLGTGGATALGVNVGSAGAFATNNAANVFSGQQSTSITTLSISTTTFTPDGSNNNYKIVLTTACNSGACTLANPSTTPVAGISGVIEVDQPSSGGSTAGFGSNYGSYYIAAGGTSSISLSTGANDKDFIPYYVADTTHIVLNLAAANATH